MAPDVVGPGGGGASDGPSRAQLARRVVGFIEAMGNRLATEVQRLPFGMARFCPDLPLVYSLQSVEIDRPVAVSELEPRVERLFEGLGSATLWTTRSEVAWSLGPALLERGWTPGREVHMVHDRATPSVLSPIGFQAVDADAYDAYDARRVAEEPWFTPEVATQMSARNHRLEQRMDAGFVMSRAADAGCHVYRFGTIAQVEEVGVLTEARGQGLGAGLMAAGLRECGDAETVFLVADADDWPRDWYGRLGFTEVATAWRWDREQAGATFRPAGR